MDRSFRALVLACATVVAVTSASAPVAAQGVATPRFKLDLLGKQVPDLRAAAGIVFNPQTNEVLWGENQHEQRPIASLTKLMTALTFMASQPDLSQGVTVKSTDVRNASVTYLRTGDVISYKDLLHLALIASDNGAARVLARTAEGGTAGFVARMNDMAMHLGLTNSHFVDSSGLDARDVSSAYDVSQLVSLVSAHEILGPITQLKNYEARTSKRRIPIRTTNRLLDTASSGSVGGKTGFIRKAGYCLASLFQDAQGAQVAVVVLGATSSTTRFWEARHLFNWVVGRGNGLPGGLIPNNYE